MLKLEDMPVPNCVKECRAGKFYIKQDFIDKYPHIVMGIMGKCIVVRAESHFHGNSIEYFAYSPEFESLGEEYGHVHIPNEYDIVVHASGVNFHEFTVEFKKCNEEKEIHAMPLRTISFGDSNEKTNLSPSATTIDVGMR